MHVSSSLQGRDSIARWAHEGCRSEQAGLEGLQWLGPPCLPPVSLFRDPCHCRCLTLGRVKDKGGDMGGSELGTGMQDLGSSTRENPCFSPSALILDDDPAFNATDPWSCIACWAKPKVANTYSTPSVSLLCCASASQVRGCLPRYCSPSAAFFSAGIVPCWHGMAAAISVAKGHSLTLT